MKNFSSFKMRLQARSGAFLVCLGVAVSSLPVHAQYSPSASFDLGVGFGQMALSQSILSSARNSTGKRRRSGKSTSKSKTTRPKTTTKSTPTQSTPSPTSLMAVRWDDAVSRQFQQQLVNRILAKNPEVREPLTQRLNHLNPPKSFRQLAYQYGLSPFSIPDLTATYCVANWEIAQQRKASPQKILAFRNAIRSEIANNPSALRALRESGAKGKQQLAESLAYEAVMNRNMEATLQGIGDKKQLEQFRNETIKNARVRGVAIEDMPL